MAVGKYPELYDFVCLPIAPSNIVYLAKGRNTRTEMFAGRQQYDLLDARSLDAPQSVCAIECIQSSPSCQIYSRKFSDKRTVIIDSQMMSKDFRWLGARMRNV